MVSKTIIRLLSRWQIQLAILFVHVLLGLFSLYSFESNYQLSEDSITKTVYDKQQIIARSGAKSVENFINNIQTQLFAFVFSFAGVSESATFDLPAIRKEFSDYINITKPPISGVALYDTNGKLLVIGNKENITFGEGQEYMNDDLLSWSKQLNNKNKFYITPPIISQSGATKGKNIMSIATPVYFGNRFKGVLAIRFLIEQFKDAFISPLISSPDEDSFIIDTQGSVIAGENDLINKSLFDYATKQNWNGVNDFKDKLHLLLTQDSGNNEWNFAYPNQSSRLYTISFKKVDIPDTDRDLYLIISSPDDNALKPLLPIRDYGSVWAKGGMLLTLVGGSLFIAVRYAAKRK